jgi:hypothetical protein
VEPGTIPDSVTRVDGWLTGSGLRAEIGSPRKLARTRVGRQSLAVCVYAFQTTQVTAIANRLDGHEERHQFGGDKWSRSVHADTLSLRSVWG